MNFLFWSDVQNKDPTSYNALLEMIRRKIIIETTAIGLIEDSDLLKDNKEEV